MLAKSKLNIIEVLISKALIDSVIYSHLSFTSSEDVFKTSSSRPIYSSWLYVFKTSLRHFQDVLPRRLQDVFKTSSRRLAKTSRHLQNVFKTSCKNAFKTSSRRLHVVFKTSCKDIFKMFSRRIIKLNCSC